MTNIAKPFSRLALGLALLSAPVSYGESVGISANAAADLLYQLETLQQEVSMLRGKVEEQEHELNKMRERQRERYVDLDKRISFILSQQSAKAPLSTPTPLTVVPIQQVDTVTSGVPQPAVTQSAPIVSTAPIVSKPVSTGLPSAPIAPVALTPPSQKAEEAYKASYELIRGREFDKAKVAFEKFVQDYPRVTLTGNAHYWLGELELVLGNPAAAITQFSTVISQFSGHAKVADATYKLGIVSDQIGEKDVAIQYLQRVVSDFPGTDSATKARTYLTNLK